MFPGPRRSSVPRALATAPGSAELAIALLLWAVAGAGGCGGTDEAANLSPAVFEGAPALSVTSAKGQLRVDVRFSPNPPAVGVVAGELTITDLSGAPSTGHTVTVVPWMAAHGHGTSARPAVSEVAPGVYVATPLNLFMSGEWQLRTTIAGTVHDTAAPTFELP